MAPTCEQTSASPAGAGSETTALTTVQSLGSVVGPSALVTALLFYFGWAKTNAFCQYFGINVSMLGLSTQDYLLQSIHSLLIPLGGTLIAGLVLLWAHRVVSRHLGLRPDSALWPWLAVVLAVSGAALFVTGMAKYPDTNPTDAVLILTPLSLTAGVGLFSYAILVERHRRHPAHAAHNTPSALQGRPGLSLILVSMLLTLGVIWVVANYADIKGREEASFIHDQLQFQPGVVVFSSKRLQISAGKVQETRFTDPESAYGYRYDGLKLLFYNRGKYFLVPALWVQSGGTTIVLDENPSLRVELVHPTT